MQVEGRARLRRSAGSGSGWPRQGTRGQAAGQQRQGGRLVGDLRAAQMSETGSLQRSSVRGMPVTASSMYSTHRKQTMLTAISFIAGIGAGALALIQARGQPPQKARQLRMLSLVPFGMAGLMLLVFLL